MTKLASTLALLWLVPAPGLVAQQEFVKFPKGDVSWKIEIVYHDREKEKEKPAEPGAEQPEPPMRMNSMLVDRVGNLRRDKVTWSNGAQTTTWWSLDPAFTMFEDPRIGQVIAQRPGELFQEIRLDASTFTWIDASCQVEEETRNGRPTRHYRRVFPNFGVFQAWVDVETGIPLAFDNEAALYKFTLLPDVPAPLELPPENASMLERFLALRAPSPVSPNKRRR